MTDVKTDDSLLFLISLEINKRTGIADFNNCMFVPFVPLRKNPYVIG